MTTINTLFFLLTSTLLTVGIGLVAYFLKRMIDSFDQFKVMVQEFILEQSNYNSTYIQKFENLNQRTENNEKLLIKHADILIKHNSKIEKQEQKCNYHLSKK